MKDLLIEGTFRANERGFGFVTIDPEEPDVYIPKEATNFAMDGDTVLIDVIQHADPFSDRGAEGKVKEIKERAVSQVVGEFVAYSEEEMAEMGLYGYMIPKDKKLNQYTVSIAPEGIKPVDGSIVIAEITYYPDQEYPTSMEGLVKQVIGHKMIQEWIFYQSWWLMEFPQHFLMKF